MGAYVIADFVNDGDSVNGRQTYPSRDESLTPPLAAHFPLSSSLKSTFY